MKTLGIIYSNIHERDIKELTKVRTLASVPFGGRYRLIDFVLSNMVNSGITNVGIITKYNYQSLMDHVQSGKNWDLSRKSGGLTILPPFNNDSLRGVYSSRLEAIKSIEGWIRHNDADFVVMADCDIVCNFDFLPAISRHAATGADITLIYRRFSGALSDKKRMVLSTDHTGKVTRIGKNDGTAGDYNVYTDFMIMSRRLLLYILDHADEWGLTSFSNDIIMNLRDYKIYGYMMDGYWAPVSSLSDYYKHSMELLDPEVVKELFYKDGAGIYTKVRDSVPSRFLAGASVKNSMIADGCHIEGTVENSIIFRGVRIKKGSIIRNSIIMQDAVVEENSTLNCVIMDKSSRVLEGRLLSGHPTHPYLIEKETEI